jgi:hypothetical protein
MYSRCEMRRVSVTGSERALSARASRARGASLRVLEENRGVDRAQGHASARPGEVRLGAQDLI